MFDKALDRFFMPKKYVIDVKLVKIGLLLAKIWTGPYWGVWGPSQVPHELMAISPDGHPSQKPSYLSLIAIPLEKTRGASNVSRTLGVLLEYAVFKST